MPNKYEILLTIKAKTERAEKEISSLKKEIDSLGKTAKSSNGGFANQEKTMKGVGAAASSLTKTMIGLAAAYASLGVAKEFVSTMSDIEQGFVDIAKTTGASEEQMKIFTDGLYEMTKTLHGISLQELQEIAAGAGQLGVKTDDILRFTGSIAKISVATNLAADEASTDFAVIGNAFGEPVENIEKLGSVVNELSATTAATVGKIVDATKRLAPVGSAFGLSSDQVMAFGAAIADAGLQTELGSTAIADLFSKMQIDTEKFAKASGVSIEEYSTAIKTKPVEAVTTLLANIKKLEDEGTPAVETIKELGMSGSGSSQTIIALANHTDILTKSLKTASKAYEEGTSVEIEYQKASKTIDAGIKDVDASFTRLRKELISELTPAISKALREFEKWMDSLDGKTLGDFAGSFDLLVSSIKGVYDALSALSDYTMPDWLGGKDSTFFGTVAEGWGKIFSTIHNISNMLDSVDLASKLKVDTSSFEKAIKDFDNTKKSYKNLANTAQELLQKNLELQKTFQDNGSKEAKAQLAELKKEQDKVMNLSEKLAKLNPYLKQADGAKKAAAALKKYTKEQIDSLKNAYAGRLKIAKETIGKIKTSEKELVDDIAKINQDLNKKLADIAKQRFDSERSTDKRIKDIKYSLLSEDDAYKQKQLDSQTELSKAKEALYNDELDKYKEYMSRYIELSTDGAGKAIESEGKVLVSKEATAAAAIAALNNEKALNEEFYKKKEQLAKNAHDALIVQKNAELEATKAQLEAQKALMKGLEELLEKMTGNKVGIDTYAIDKAIEKVSNLQKKVTDLSASPMKIGADSSQLDPVVGKIDDVRAKTSGVKLDIDISDAGAKLSAIEEKGRRNINSEFVLDTSWADGSIERIFKTNDGRRITINVDGNIDDANNKIDSLSNQVAAQTLVAKLDVDSTGAMTAFDQFGNIVSSTQYNFTLGANSDDVRKKIDETKQQTNAPIKIDIEGKNDKAKQSIKAIGDEAKRVKPTVNIGVKKEKYDSFVNSAKKPIKQDVSFTPDGSYSKLKGIIKELGAPISALFNVSLDSSVSKALSVRKELEKPIVTTQTIYIKKIEAPMQKKLGGYIQKFSDGGYPIRSGALGGYGGGDRIKALVEAGEFIHNKDAVRLYGLDFMDAINDMMIPVSLARSMMGGIQKMSAVRARRFSEGGGVGATNNGTIGAPVVLNIAGSSFKMMAEEEVAKAMARVINREGGF